MDVADERPAIVLREMLPGGHGAAPIADFPEELAVRLRLDFLRGPVGRLGAEGGRGHAIALALGAVTGDAVHLGDLLPLIHDLLVVGQGILLRLIRRGASHGAWAYATPARASAPKARVSDDVLNFLVMLRSPPSKAPSRASEATSRVAFAS